jgi:UDP-2-acetamido-3-amino-2,3-dideoxy-glucuronate N-acetyltransferase
MSAPPPSPALPTVAVIGCGYWGRNLVRNFHALGALRAVCDHNPTAATVMAAEFGVPALDFASILGREDIAAVIIAAPAEQHFALAQEALLAGKHVYVEKPLALDIDHARTLCQLAERVGRTLMVGHLLQYHPAFLKLKDIVLAGRLGRIQYVYSNRLNLGKIRTEENILWSFAPHDISMILSLIGAMPDKVLATGKSYLHQAIADVTTMHMSFAGGPAAHIHVSWLHPFKEQRLVVVCERGMAVFDDGLGWDEKLKIYPHHINWVDNIPTAAKAESEAVPVEQGEPLRLECQHFLECVRTGDRPRTDGQEGLRVLTLLAAAEASMRSGAEVSPTVPTAKPATDYFVHETAWVDQPSTIGTGTRIWHFSHVLPQCRIGPGCNIGQNVMIGPDVSIGRGCKLQNNVSVYTGVTLEDDVFCGPSAVFTNVINPRADVERKTEYRPTLVKKGATIGANATIVCGVTLGERCFVGAGAVVTRDVPAHALVVGSPARIIGWVSHTCERLGDDLVCPASGRRYRLAAPDRLEEITEES